MSKDKRKSTKPRKPDQDEPIEGYIPDHPEDENFDVDISVDIDMDENEGTGGPRRRSRGSGWEEIFGENGIFGREGPFGANGPFGASGPFGRNGPFADDFPFGAKSGFGTSARRRPARSRRYGDGRAKRMFGQGELRLALLVLVAEHPRHGYELIKDIEEMTGGTYAPSPGAVYPTLQLLADEGMIEEAQSTDAKKPYQATDAGMDELAGRKGEVQDLMGRIASRGKRARDARSPDLFRAMANLAAVLRNKASDGKLGKDNIDAIVDIIDDVAKRIERF
ncbi:MAG: PadR family transcriptional regulator [Erythrobacter sp.]|jgi:DNA-binding PadR family transcriptional regulator|nr:PadR family transcriptional regulator [Erythrobacter sp.]